MSHYSHVVVFNQGDDGSFKVRVREDVPGFDWSSLSTPLYRTGRALFVPTELEDGAEARKMALNLAQRCAKVK